MRDVCDDHVPVRGWTRRAALGGGLAAALWLPAAWRHAPAAVLGGSAPEVRRRSDWTSTAPRGPLPDEPDVRFLLVHHTVHPNGYGPDDVPVLLRGMLGYHTGPAKGWPDIAYNFLVDRFGRVWEGRAGSLDGPVAGDATGGSQGFDQKCAFIGDHSAEPPAPEARAAMASLLAMLADRHGIDTRPGAAVTFASRGSNRHPPGVAVRTATITGHRTMSSTACPGDAAFAFVRDELPEAVTRLRQAPATSSTTTTAATAATPVTTAPPATTTATPAPTTSTAAPLGSTATTGSERAAPAAADEGGSLLGAALGAAAAGLGGIAIAAVLRRRQALG